MLDEYKIQIYFSLSILRSEIEVLTNVKSYSELFCLLQNFLG
jgi:hypothetical protein